MADQENFPDIYIDESVSPGGVGSLADPYSDFSEINWTTGGDNSIYDYYNNTPTASVTINLKKGEVWREQFVAGTSGVATYPILIQDYGSGNKPKILGSVTKNVTGDWTEESTDLWYCSLNGGVDIGLIVADSENSILGDKQETKVAVDAQGEFWYDSGNDRVYLFSSSNPATYYNGVIELAQKVTAFSFGGKDYVTLDGIDVRYVGYIGILLHNNCDYDTVQNCDLSYNGGSYLSGVNRSGNAIQISVNVTNILIDSNTVSQTYDMAISLETSSAFSNITQSDVTISNNTFNTSGGAIQFFCHATGSCTISNININNNVCNNTGGGWSGVDNNQQGQGIALYSESGVSLSNFKVFQNTVDTTNGTGSWYGTGIFLGGGPFQVYRNMVKDTSARGIHCITRLEEAFRGNLYYNIVINSGHARAVDLQDVSVATTFHNNVIYHDGDYGLLFWNSSNITAKNNVIYMQTTGQTMLYVQSGCSSITLDNNCYYNSGGGFKIHWLGANKTDFATYQADSGQDANGMNADPIMVNPGSDDFHLQVNSPCIEAGVDVGLTEDYDGVTVPKGIYPDIGAFEFVSTLNLFEDFKERWGKGVHQFHSGGHTLKVYLTNNAPDAALDAIKADLVGITEENGYAPADIQNDWSESAGVGTLTGVDVTFTAAGGSFGPFRYAVLYNDTPTGPDDPLIGWYDYGSAITCLDTQTFKVDFGTKILDMG